jgi:aspartate kinase
MSLIVQKFGGTSVGSIERIKNVAKIIQQEKLLGNQVVVVVSAMSGETNKLIDFCEQISIKRDKDILAEYDVVATSGEQVTSGLVAMALRELGVKARSVLAWQAKIICDNNYTAARIVDIETQAIEGILSDDGVPVVAGFQGIDQDNRYVTLGRGGSDTSAVALAAKLEADRCDIYTDVDGIYTADPRLVKNAQRINKISYEEMLELSSLGAKVMHTRSIEMAMKSNVKVRVLSSFEKGGGTIICKESDEMEQRLITGVAHSMGEVCITLKNMPEEVDLALIFGLLSGKNINIDMIIQIKTPQHNSKDVSFSINKKDLLYTLETLESSRQDIKYQDIFSKENLAKVSIVGVAMKYHAGVAAEMFKIIEDLGIKIYAVTTSEIKISVLLDENDCDKVANALHEAFALDEESAA